MVRRFFAACIVAGMVLAVQSTANAELIYNSFDGLNQTTNSFTTTGSTPRNFMADEMSTLALADPTNQDWRVEQLGLRLFVVGSGSAGVNQIYNNVTMRIRVYNDWDNSAPADTSVFSDLVSDVTWNLGTLTNTSSTGGAQAFTFNLDYLANGLQFLLDDGQDMGISVELLENGVANQGLALLLRSVAGDPGFPAIGTSPNGWYRDSDSDGIIEATDRRVLTGTNSNAHFQINATAVPEPTSALLLLGLAGLFAARRNRG